MQPSVQPVSESPLPRLLQDLRSTFGDQGHWKRRDPLGELVFTLLAADTPRPLAEEVFARLKTKFFPWSRLAEARTDEVASIIAPVARAWRKAEDLPAALRAITRLVGSLNLHWLEHAAPEDALAWLSELPTVTRTDAAAVLNLSTLRRPIFVCASPAERVVKRLGLATADDDAAGCREAIMDLVPGDWGADELAELERLLGRLAEATCRPTTPECSACSLRPLCPTGSKQDKRAHGSAANENRAAGGRLEDYLRRRIEKLERQGVSARSLADGGVSWGCKEIDAAFMGGTLPPGAHQTAGLRMEDRAAALLPALATAIRLPEATLRLLIVQELDARREHGELFGPGLEALGLKPSSTAFVRARDGAQALEVADEALRSHAAPVVLLELRRSARLADLSVTRRFNMAARRSGAFLFLITPDLEGASAAVTRWRVSGKDTEAPKRRLGPPRAEFDLVRNRAGPIGRWTVEWSASSRSLRTVRDTLRQDSLGLSGLAGLRRRA